MDYDQHQFSNLTDEVEVQGGTHLDGMCVAKRYEMSGDKGGEVTLGGCGNHTLFAVPYARDSRVLLCAVCDAMGMMPRFKEAMS